MFSFDADREAALERKTALDKGYCFAKGDGRRRALLLTDRARNDRCIGSRIETIRVLIYFYTSLDIPNDFHVYFHLYFYVEFNDEKSKFV